MTQTADAIIIGAGVIGAATAFELAKLGYKTLSIDRNAEAGHGSTSSSCAIIRVHYSTLDGTALSITFYLLSSAASRITFGFHHAAHVFLGSKIGFCFWSTAKTIVSIKIFC